MFKLAEARTSSRSQCLAVSSELSQVPQRLERGQSGADIKQGQSGDNENMKWANDEGIITSRIYAHS